MVKQIYWYVLAAFLFAAAGCGPKAKVTRTTPVADLRPYRVVAVRAAGSGQGANLVQQLEMGTVSQLASRCQFDSVVPASHLGSAQPDLVLDLNIQRAFRGGTGMIQNQNKAVVEVLAVLSDGVTQDLLGSAWIQGESSSVLVTGASPEGQAVDAVAKKIADVLGKSGCRGERIARAPEQPEQPAEGGETAGEAGGENGGAVGGESGQGDPARREGAEALNDEGKALFKQANIEGAVDKFKAASALYPDPRYDFNLCISYETLKRYDEALAMCQQVIDKKPEQRLVDKAKSRIAIIQDLRAGK